MVSSGSTTGVKWSPVHVQAWCNKNGITYVLSNWTTERYTKFICKDEVLGVGTDQQRKTSFKHCAGKLGALRDLRLKQLAEGLYTADQVQGYAGLGAYK